MGEKITSIRGDIMEMIKLKFSNTSFWKKVEADIALSCAELPEPMTQIKKDELIKKLKAIKEFILKQNIPKEDLQFLEDEIKLHEEIKIISLYEEKEDELEPHVLRHCISAGRGTEGIVAIPQPYNYKQLSQLTDGVYKKTNLVKFYISREQTLYGKITSEIYEHAQEIPIATVIESKKIDKETGEPQYKRINLFGQKYNRAEVNIIKEINLRFYVYRFITENRKDMILMTTTPCEIGDYIITGVETQCDDYKMLTDSARLPTKLPFFFSQEIKNRIIMFENHKELGLKIKELGINNKDFFDYPFTASKGKRKYKLLHPKWYKQLIWSWLTHEKKGMMNNYPLHLMIIGQPGAGKSFLLNSLHEKSKEYWEIFSGAGSTLKSLVPSFKYNPAKIGYLGESNRFSFLDEFLRCLINTKTTKEGSQREESVAIMNDLLEHQKREVGSGVSKQKVNMTARVIAATNPVNGVNNVGDLVRIYDASFLSRWLIYYQTDEHRKIVRGSNDSDLEIYPFKLELNDWISIIDYLQSFSADYDLSRILKIHKSIPDTLSEDLKKHYDTRHKHHIECVMDGIIKTRCFLENDMSFKATEEDYKTLKEVWYQVIKSWIDPSQIKTIRIEDRINYLPENCQYIYARVCEKKKPLGKDEIKEIALKSMSRIAFYEALSILLEMRVLISYDNVIRPHYMEVLRDKK